MAGGKIATYPPEAMVSGEGAELTSSNGVAAETFLQELSPLQPQLERFCRRVLLRRGEFEDALQSAIGKAYRISGSSPKGPIFGLGSTAMSHSRRSIEIAPQLGTASSAAWRTSRRRRCYPSTRLVGKRSILLLRAIGEFSYREIANILGVPMGTVMGLLSRARQTLRLNLHEYACQQGFFRRGDSA